MPHYLLAFCLKIFLKAQHPIQVFWCWVSSCQMPHYLLAFCLKIFLITFFVFTCFIAGFETFFVHE